MANFRVLLYKSKVDGKWIDNAIAIVTQVINLWRLIGPQWKVIRKIIKAGYSHAEIWVPDKDERFVISQTGPKVLLGNRFKNVWLYDTLVGTCYTSTMGQVRSKSSIDQSGTVKRDANKLLKHPDRWDYINISVNEPEYKDIVKYLDKLVAENKGYGVLPGQDVCSEVVNNALVEADVLDKTGLISPLLLAVRLVKRHYVVRKLH